MLSTVNTHPQLKNTSIKYQYSSKTHTEKHLYQCNTKYRRFEFFKHENTKKLIFSSLSLSDVKPPTQLTQIRPELQIIDNQAKIQIPDDFPQFRCKYFPINVWKSISKVWNQAPRCICSPQSSFSEQLSNYSEGGRIVMTVSARTWWLFLFCGWSIFPFGMLKDFKRFFLPNRNTCLFYRWTQFNTIVFGLVA